MHAAPVLFIVVPCYNEELALPETARRLLSKLHQLIESGRIADRSRILLVDDGSADATWQQIAQLQSTNPVVAGLKLARNFGHQRALLAGLMTARQHADVVISLDADLQDDIQAMDAFLDARETGAEIVYGVRCARRTDTLFKRVTAARFYRFMSFCGIEIVAEHADYRLMTRRALDYLADFPEVNLFLRGIVPMLGLQTAQVPYERGQRLAGESKYQLGRMLNFAADGLTSLSIKPVRLISLLGAGVFILSIGMLVYTVFRHFTGHTIVGWSSLAVSIWALGGLQLLAIGVLGEYVAKTYLESKRRPRFLIEKTIGDIA